MFVSDCSASQDSFAIKPRLITCLTRVCLAVCNPRACSASCALSLNTRCCHNLTPCCACHRARSSSRSAQTFCLPCITTRPHDRSLSPGVIRHMRRATTTAKCESHAGVWTPCPHRPTALLDQVRADRLDRQQAVRDHFDYTCVLSPHRFTRGHAHACLAQVCDDCLKTGKQTRVKHNHHMVYSLVVCCVRRTPGEVRGCAHTPVACQFLTLCCCAQVHSQAGAQVEPAAADTRAPLTHSRVAGGDAALAVLAEDVRRVEPQHTTRALTHTVFAGRLSARCWCAHNLVQCTTLPELRACS